MEGKKEVGSDFHSERNPKGERVKQKWERQEYTGRHLGDIPGTLISSNDVSWTSHQRFSLPGPTYTNSESFKNNVQLEDESFHQ